MRALHVSSDTEVVVEGAEIPANLFIEKRKIDSIPRKKSMWYQALFSTVGISCANTSKYTLHKKSISRNKNISGLSRRNSKILSKALVKIDQRPKHIGHYLRVVDTLQKKTFCKIKKSKGDRHVQGSEDSGKPESFRYVEKWVMGKKGM